MKTTITQEDIDLAIKEKRKPNNCKNSLAVCCPIFQVCKRNKIPIVDCGIAAIETFTAKDGPKFFKLHDSAIAITKLNESEWSNPNLVGLEIEIPDYI